MTKVCSKEEILKFPGGDVRLLSVEWVGDTGLRLTVALPGPPTRVARLLCSFVTALRINFEFGNLAGAPLTWDTTLAELPGAGWHVLLDFAGAPDGIVEFDCEHLVLEYDADLA